ncbi:hypothetical protein DPMN_157633 [Dreissena polymorpha]|uniref:Uncharacterized protein n=1 Tax=Dreissena polymorpha TaxID=45954 RepID=A0A9D4IL82_DREPO|nr:hypothetical protein DPMN_157633 [Dreissena polymorpha]
MYSVLCVHVKRPGLEAVEYDGMLLSLYLAGKLKKLLVHNLLSLAIAAVAMAILIRTSAVLPPSLDRVAPQCLKLVTNSRRS